MDLSFSTFHDNCPPSTAVLRFIGHPDAGQRSAIIYSIVVSCQRHGIDPFAYIKDVLSRLPAMTNQQNLDDLLPSSWKPLSQS
jgi:hypothetical protein